MKTDAIRIRRGLDLFSRLSVDEREVALTWRYGRRGWRRLLAFNPVDRYLYNGIGSLQLEKFANSYPHCLLMGSLSFELGYGLQGLPRQTAESDDFPLVDFKAYRNFLEFTPGEGILHFQDAAYPGYIREIMKRETPDRAEAATPEFSIRISPEEYQNRLDHIFNYIRAGDIYQVNFTHRLDGSTQSPPRQLFRSLITKNPVSHAAYFESDDSSVLSLSPERFMKISNGQILTEPIKGTRPRGRNAAEDKHNLSKLLNSSKEQAELFMISDLLRNDLGKICKIGSVYLIKKKAIQRLVSVFHTYSQIVGELHPDLSPLGALLSMFPGGSISGCPKRRALEIIAALETDPREIYTGAMGYILPGGELEFNLAIRTLIQRGRRLSLGMGGGITIDSVVREEFEETLSKAASFGVIGR